MLSQEGKSELELAMVREQKKQHQKQKQKKKQKEFHNTINKWLVSLQKTIHPYSSHKLPLLDIWTLVSSCWYTQPYICNTL